jgi:energy-coupling factor transporter ATP-binding protein EcfA2
MPWVTATQLELALEELAPHHPLLLFTIPAMCKTGVEVAASQQEADAAARDKAKAHYSGRDETQFLRDYTAVKGGPTGRPFYSPSTPTGKRGAWVVSSYATSSLQAQRKERLGRVFLQSGDFFYPFGADWGEFAEKLRAEASGVMKRMDGAIQRVPLFALASWFLRDREVGDAAALLQLAKDELKLPDELMGSVYDDTIPADAAAIAIGADRITQEDLAAIVEAVPPPPPLEGGFPDLVAKLETSLTKRVVLGEDIVGQIVRAWAARDIVILVGAGGTGKTTLAKGIVSALAEILPPESEVEVPVDQDFGISDLVGYENLAGKFVDRPLTARILRSKNRLHPHVLLLEEFNLAAVESYLGPLLHAIESDSAIPLTSEDSAELPQDTLVLATCNSPRDEPETRIPMSGPTKRRATAIQMPNLLFNEWSTKGEDGLHKVIALMLRNERDDIEARFEAGRGSWLDAPRLGRLEAVTSTLDLESTTRETLIAVTAALLDTEEGRRWMTFGPLRDVVVQLVWAEIEDQSQVLGQLVVGKLLQQVQSTEVALLVADKCSALPNAEFVVEAARALAGPGATIRPLI